MKKKSTNEKSNPIKALEKYIYLVILLVPVLVPISFGYHAHTLTKDELLYWSNSGVYHDIQVYPKYLMLLVLTSMSLLTLSFFAKSRERRNSLGLSHHLHTKNIVYIIPFLYLILAFISAVITNTSFAWEGFVDRHEGFFTLVGYILVFYLTLVSLQKHKYLELLLCGLMIAAVFQGCIGLLQMLNLDPFRSDWMLNWMIPEGLALKIRMPFGYNLAYGTLVNPNYAGQYAATLLPISICMSISKKRLLRILGVVALLFLFLLLFGSNARAAFIATFITFVVLFALLWRQVKWTAAILPITLMIIAYISTNMLIDGKLLADTVSLVNPSVVSDELENLPTESTPQILGIEMTPLDIQYHVVEGDLSIQYNPGTNALSFYGNGSSLSAISKDDVLYLDHPFQRFTITIKSDRLRIAYGTRRADFVLKNNQFYIPVSSTALSPTIQNPKKSSLIPNLSFASARGFLWAVALPMLPNYLIYGVGPDGFATAFPQNDILDKLNVYGSAFMVINKPHNWFLQIAIETSLLSLILILLFTFIILFKSITHYIQNRFSLHNEPSTIPDRTIFAGIICGILAYLVCALANDSSLGTAPLFWSMLGSLAVYTSSWRNVVDKQGSRGQ